MDVLLENAYLAVAAILLAMGLVWVVVFALFVWLGGWRRPFLLGLVFAALHVAAVAAVALTTPADMTATPLAGIGWLFLSIVNYPTTLLFPRSGTGVPLVGFFILFGTLHQFLVGTVFAAVYAWFRQKEAPQA